MDDDLLFRRDALMKRRSELIQEIADCADSIAKIDAELRIDAEDHRFDGVDPDANWK